MHLVRFLQHVLRKRRMQVHFECSGAHNWRTAYIITSGRLESW